MKVYVVASHGSEDFSLAEGVYSSIEEAEDKITEIEQNEIFSEIDEEEYKKLSAAYNTLVGELTLRGIPYNYMNRIIYRRFKEMGYDLDRYNYLHCRKVAVYSRCSIKKFKIEE
nr:MAG TPA: phosphotransferase system component EIIA [Caudoviricetes sp.]